MHVNKTSRVVVMAMKIETQNGPHLLSLNMMIMYPCAWIELTPTLVIVADVIIKARSCKTGNTRSKYTMQV